MNSNVPHFRSLASLSFIEIIIQSEILILSSVRSNKHMMASFCERITNFRKLFQLHFNSSIYNGEIIKLQFALNDDYNKHVPHFKVNNWKIFFQNLCSYVHFRAVSLIHSALQRNAATFCKVLVPFSSSHVIDYCFLLSLFSLSFFFSFFIL